MLDKIIFLVCIIVGIFGTINSFLTDELGMLLLSGFWLGYGIGLLEKIILNSGKGEKDNEK